MARAPRFDLPGIPQHVVQRGNDRQACFADDIDRERYAALLADALSTSGCRLHAYVLMGNHVHLLLSPQAAGGVATLMQTLGRRYVPWFNLRHRRSGTLWEGRYKACPVDDDRYLLACSRYIDLNPVRAGIVRRPADYRWSSCGHHVGIRNDPLVTAHPTQVQLGDDEQARRRAYAALLGREAPAGERAAIRQHLQQQKAWGGDAFRRRVETISGRSTVVRPPHRPARKCV